MQLLPIRLIISTFKVLWQQGRKHLSYWHLQMFWFWCNYFTLQYIILYYMNKHATYKFGWNRNKSREVNLN